MNALPAILALTLVVVLTRTFFLIFGERFRPEGRLAQALDFAPLAALVAIVVPEFIGALELGGFSLSFHLSDGRIASALVVITVGLLTRNSLYSLLAGAATYGVLILA
jgi:branched-subunit amino acid transport protein